MSLYLSVDSVLMGVIADNNLSFIETSAFDASNVEQAFHKILTGMSPRFDELERLIILIVFFLIHLL